MMSSLIFIVILPAVLAEDPWSMTGVTGPGPEDWKLTYPLCNGSRPEAKQTPINVIQADTEYNENLTPFQFYGHDSLTGDDVTIRHNGYTGEGYLKAEAIGKAYFTGGGYNDNDRFYLVIFHVHWGPSDHIGSEHSFGDKFYSAAVHMGYFNSKYGSLPNASNYEDGVAGLVHFFKSSGKDNDELEPYIDALQRVPNKGNSTVLNSGLGMFLSSDTTKYYRYPGSMPIPPCREYPVWTLFKKPNDISSAQLAKIRTSLYDPVPPTLITDNRRPTQPLNQRVVQRSFDGGDDDDEQ